MTDLDRSARMTSDASGSPVGLFVLGFLGLLCAMAIGFLSEFHLLKQNSSDYGYDEALGTQTSSQSQR